MTLDKISSYVNPKGGSTKEGYYSDAWTPSSSYFLNYLLVLEGTRCCENAYMLVTPLHFVIFLSLLASFYT